MNDRNTLAVKVWGPLACFTRPEMKVERVSYDVMTPSAARGILEAIFWKPEFSWRVRSIEVLEPVRRFSVLRNEVKKKASSRSAFKNRFYADENRTQRNTLALRDVAYVIRGSVDLRPSGKDEHPEKYRAQFRRRVSKGQCYHRPCLGCREFAAHFAAPTGDEKPIAFTTDLGRMLFDIRYEGKKGRGTPVFFNARMENGTLDIPVDLYSQVEA
jgi:CRISPR-associated protein Cas5d